MAYNPYLPYQPYYQPIYQQPIQAQPNTYQQTQANVMPTQSGIIWVSGESEASLYPIAPNNAVVLWEKTGKTIYLKSADVTGKPSMKIYDLVERTELPSESVPNAEAKLPDYATKEDLGEVLSAVKVYDSTIGNLKADIDAIKSDMYGIAGKKKPVRKVADDDE